MGIAGALLAAFHMPVYGQAGAPLINEFVINHTGSDVNEFIEVFGVPNTAYSAFTILEIEGDDGGALGVVDGVFPVGTTNADGVWTTGLLNSVVENGTVTLLLVKNFTGNAGLDLDTNDDGFLPLELQAKAGEVALELVLDSSKPIVLNGEGGLSRKSDEPGNASYY